jgi:hypothetical protein
MVRFFSILPPLTCRNVLYAIVLLCLLISPQANVMYRILHVFRSCGKSETWDIFGYPDQCIWNSMKIKWDETYLVWSTMEGCIQGLGVSCEERGSSLRLGPLGWWPPRSWWCRPNIIILTTILFFYWFLFSPSFYFTLVFHSTLSSISYIYCLLYTIKNLWMPQHKVSNCSLMREREK